MGRNDVLVDLDSKAIRDRRLALGITRQSLSQEAGVGISSVQIAELGTRPLSTITVHKIMSALDRMEAGRAESTDPLGVLLTEIRAVRQLHEETRAKIEAIEARLEGGR